MKVVFFGNHTVGVQAIKSIVDQATLVGVVAHPLDSEEGTVYESVFDYAYSLGVPAIRANAKDLKTHKFVSNLSPDLIWITDYKFLLPLEILSIPPLGVVNIHPSLLPKYRGRAPLNWALINGENEVGLTAHYVDEGIDSGDIIAQERITVKGDDYIGDVLDKTYPVYRELTTRVLVGIEKGSLERVPQKPEGKVWPRRTPKDGKINWDKSINDIVNLIRAVSHPYPGAFSMIDNSPMVVWKAVGVSPENHPFAKQGEIVEVDATSIHIKCKDGLLKITEWDFVGNELKIGTVLT